MMKSTRNKVILCVSIIILLLVGGVLIIFFSGVNNFDNNEIQIIKDESISQKIKEIEIAWKNGTVTVYQSKDGMIHLRELVPLDAQGENEFKHSIENTKLTINMADLEADNSVVHNLEIALPGNTRLNEFNYNGEDTYLFTSSIRTEKLNVKDQTGKIRMEGIFKTVNFEADGSEATLKCHTQIPNTVNINDQNANLTLLFPREDTFELNTEKNDGYLNCEFPKLKEVTFGNTETDKAKSSNIASYGYSNETDGEDIEIGVKEAANQEEESKVTLIVNKDGVVNIEAF